MNIINILRATVVLVVLGVFLFVLTIVIPFIVQERLVIFLTISVLSLTFFNGRVSSNQQVVYKIIIKESK
ncbi:hypothetical protein CBF35_07350 [Vagococcus salmoninarum]|uniref:Uncharacterized protein n=1 Tax=Vagococcus salmoninarum TaxID=2739 RepID=A0A429ZQ19_9ENTE|nr:hypothetical protein CBF35_07350 [Vagococcus salmoninarum]